MKEIKNVCVCSDKLFSLETKVEIAPISYYFDEVNFWKSCGYISNPKIQMDGTLIVDLRVDEKINLIGIYPVATIIDDNLVVVSLIEDLEKLDKKPLKNDNFKSLENYTLGYM